MSFHIEPSERLQALIDAHLGPVPASYPYMRWMMDRHRILSSAVLDALRPREREILDLEQKTQGRVALGEVALEVLGQRCVWLEATCSLELGSYRGRVVLLEEMAA